MLKESRAELRASPSDLCPQCGSFLIETLQQAAPKITQTTTMPRPKTVFETTAPRFGIPELDAMVGKFCSSLCLTGRMAEPFFWRALVRSLLPVRAGGKGFSKVLLIDAGNCSDIYQCVDYARQFGLDIDKLLDGIIVTRAFTVHQLAALVSDVGKAARRFGADLVAVADMAKMFVSDPQVSEKEEDSLAEMVAGSLAVAAHEYPVLAFMSEFRSSNWLARFDTQMRLCENDGRVLLAARNRGDGSKHLSAATIPASDIWVIKRVKGE